MNKLTSFYSYFSFSLFHTNSVSELLVREAERRGRVEKGTFGALISLWPLLLLPFSQIAPPFVAVCVVDVEEQKRSRR